MTTARQKKDLIAKFERIMDDVSSKYPDLWPMVEEWVKANEERRFADCSRIAEKLGDEMGRREAQREMRTFTS